MLNKRKSKLKTQNFTPQFADWFKEIENLNQSNLEETKKTKTEIKKEILEEKPVLEILKKPNGKTNFSNFFVDQKSGFGSNFKKNTEFKKLRILSKEEFIEKNKSFAFKKPLASKLKNKDFERKIVENKVKENNFIKNATNNNSPISKNLKNDKVAPSLKKFLESLENDLNKNSSNSKEELTYTEKVAKIKAIEKAKQIEEIKNIELEKEEKKNLNKIILKKPFQLTSLKKSENSHHLQNYLGTNYHFVNEENKNFSSRFHNNLNNLPKKNPNPTFSLSNLFFNKKSTNLIIPKIYKNFAILSLIFVLTFSFFNFVGNVFAVKNNVMDTGEQAKGNLKLAIKHLENRDFQLSEIEFEKAYSKISFANDEMNKINELVVFISKFIPEASKLSSGKKLIEAGKYLTHAGLEMNSLAKITNNLVDSEDKKLSEINFLELYQNSMKHLSVVYEDFEKAKKNLDEVNLEDLPENYRSKFSTAQKMMPIVEENLKLVVDGQKSIEDILGTNGPRAYLFLFQNNQEMRATGGFIGSYGLLEISDGKIQNFKIDGIFNPGGQLTDRIVPPSPIQKISGDWSLHDSNWFPNFPTSAEKAIDFYERTGGQTVDGVITITPVVMRELLKVTGPIKVTDYDLEIDSENFIQTIQTEVEINYNQKEEKEDPKKILSDLTPLIFEKLLENKSPKNIAKIINVFSKSLDEKQILIYMRDDFTEEVVRKNGWSGEMTETDKDYLSVINTNINGFKSDGMIDENIEHSAEIFEDGSVINTVTITREHKGGKTGFSWWDAVNSNYMRIYVPKGAKLLSAEGQTREISEERLDYDKLEYERDDDLEKERQNTTIDEKTGTRIYEENNKTVFANWVYVSPQEKVKVTYKYLLPFKVKFENNQENHFGSYAVLYQKQAGSENSKIKSSFILPNNFELYWKTNQENPDSIMQKDLKTDLYHGIVFKVK